MKKIIAISAFSFLLSALGTPVLFPLQTISGQPLTAGFSITPDARLNPQTDGSNIFGGFPLAQQRLTNGAAVINLVPGGYSLLAPGWTHSLHFNVNAGTNIVNVVTLITNLASYFPVTFGGGPVTNIDNATGTNVVINDYSGVLLQAPSSSPYIPPLYSTVSGGNVDIGTGRDAIGVAGGSGGTVQIGCGGASSIGQGGSGGIVKLAIGGSFGGTDGQTTVGYLTALDFAQFNGGINLAGGLTVDSLSDGTGTFPAANAIVTTNSTVSTSKLIGVVTNIINSVAGVITNAGLVWYSVKTNAAPNFAAPSGSICTTTNGQFFVRSNTVWLLK